MLTEDGGEQEAREADNHRDDAPRAIGRPAILHSGTASFSS